MAPPAARSRPAAAAGQWRRALPAARKRRRSMMRLGRASSSTYGLDFVPRPPVRRRRGWRLRSIRSDARGCPSRSRFRRRLLMTGCDPCEPFGVPRFSVIVRRYQPVLSAKAGALPRRVLLRFFASFASVEAPIRSVSHAKILPIRAMFESVAHERPSHAVLRLAQLGPRTASAGGELTGTPEARCVTRLRRVDRAPFARRGARVFATGQRR